MDQPGKQRPKSAAVITEAYVQNKKEDECLYERLDSIHYQHYASLIRLRQTVSNIVRQREILLTQRAITPQSSLDHVLDEIYTYKKGKRCSCLTKSYMPSSTKVYVNHGSDSKWPPTLGQSLPSTSQNLYKHGEDKSVLQVTGSRALDKTTGKSMETTFKQQQSLEMFAQRPRATSPVQRRSHSSMASLTYKELSGIARLENISKREVERRKQQMKLEKQNISRLSDSNLQVKVHNFLKKLE